MAYFLSFLFLFCFLLINSNMLIGVRDHGTLFAEGGPADFYSEAKHGLDWLMNMWDDENRILYFQVFYLPLPCFYFFIFLFFLFLYFSFRFFFFFLFLFLFLLRLELEMETIILSAITICGDCHKQTTN